MRRISFLLLDRESVAGENREAGIIFNTLERWKKLSRTIRMSALKKNECYRYLYL